MRDVDTLRVGDQSYSIYRLDSLQSQWDVARLPYTLRILLANVLRTGTEAEVEAVAGWVAADEPSREISFMPARVLLQDFTGVPCVVDLAAMRDAMRDQGGDPSRINPQIPVELVIDHSVQVDEFASRLAIGRNVELEFERNKERYGFLRWGQSAFDNFAAVPPNTGICHQVNLAYLSPVDDVTLQYLRLTGRSDERIALVEAYCKENLLWHDESDHPTYTQVVELDLGDVEPSLAGPRRPQDRVPLANAKAAFIEALDTFGVDYTDGDEGLAETFPASDPTTEQQPAGG